MSFPIPTNIYRIMHIRNLERVIADGCLFCESQRSQSGPWENIAHDNIQARRRNTHVPCGTKGTVCDYIPWYYAPRSPMLYAHYRGNVAGNSEGQKPIIYFRSTVQAVMQANLSFVFTDGHAIMSNSRFFYRPVDLEKIDWLLMESKYWKATDEDPDRPRRRQAEFLVHQQFPLSLVEEIGVFDSAALTVTQNQLQNRGNRVIIRVNKHWYF